MMKFDFIKAAAIRALKTTLQTMVASLSIGTAADAINWKVVFSTSLLAGGLSLLTSIIAGLPEVDE